MVHQLVVNEWHPAHCLEARLEAYKSEGRMLKAELISPQHVACQNHRHSKVQDQHTRLVGCCAFPPL